MLPDPTAEPEHCVSMRDSMIFFWPPSRPCKARAMQDFLADPCCSRRFQLNAKHSHCRCVKRACLGERTLTLASGGKKAALVVSVSVCCPIHELQFGHLI